MKLPQLDFFLNLLPQGLRQFPSVPQKQKHIEVSPPQFEPEILYLPRLKKGWRAEWHPNGRLKLTLPGYMKDPVFHLVIKEILQWSSFARQRRTSLVKAKTRALEKQIWEHSEALLASQGKKLSTRGDRIPPIRTQGRIYDLLPHLEAVNKKYFQGELECKITWSGRVGGLSYHSQRKELQTGRAVHLISISRGYDFENCPEWALQGIIYHECLHIAVPPELSGSRRIVHGKAFRNKEKLYQAFEEWKKWHATILPVNVRKLRRSK